MTESLVGFEHNRTSSRPEITTMPSNLAIRNPIGATNFQPFPRPTVSLDPRPVVIPILSSVIGFPIVVFALICALRQRAMKLRRRDQLKKLQSGVRSVTLDIPPREKVSFFSGCSSPDMSIKEAGEKLEAFNLKPSLSTTKRNTSRNNNHVKFFTPGSPVPNTTTVEVLLHTADVSNEDTRDNGGSSWNSDSDSVSNTNMAIDPESGSSEPR